MSKDDIEARLELRIDEELASPRWRGLEPDEVESARESLRRSFWGDSNRLDIAAGDLKQSILAELRRLRGWLGRRG
jgi:hypothetical protein